MTRESTMTSQLAVFVPIVSLLIPLATTWRQGEAADDVPPAVDPIAAPAEAVGLRPLFNGKDLRGWDGDPRLWSVRDGVIHGETTAEQPTKGNTFLIFKGPDREAQLSSVFRNFELRLSFRCNATNNSGIQYRSERLSNSTNDWVVAGYQHEVRNEIDFPNVSSFIYDEKGKAGRLCNIGERAIRTAAGEKRVTGTLIGEAAFKKLFRLDDWNDVVIIAQGPRVRHFLNGWLVVEFTDNDPLTTRTAGLLALQLHGGKPMWAEFRDIRIKEILSPIGW